MQKKRVPGRIQEDMRQSGKMKRKMKREREDERDRGSVWESLSERCRRYG